MAQTNGDCVKVLKDLLSKKSGKSQGKTPSGAQPTFWMFTVPEVPKDNYNEVYPNILLGNRHVAKDKALLQQLEVTHVLNAAQGVKFNQIPTSQDFYEDVSIQYLGIPAMDISTYKMSKHFEEAAEFIDKALSSGGKVFVHCMMGVSRSATLIIAYLMMKKQMTVTDSIMQIRSKRAIFPNDGFLLQLCTLNEELYGLVTAPS
ncbi:dual specificity protein phosphatase 3-like [Liolophura sinensis]|uniref:dual specificity protein phosphatase 3-like n=1 Tax=Liolophura sinensis TaxID=3198878 RepID=UPI0031592133